MDKDFLLKNCDRQIEHWVNELKTSCKKDKAKYIRYILIIKKRKRIIKKM